MASILSARKIGNLKTLGEQRREFLRARTRKAIRENSYLEKFHDHVLDIGGEAVVLWNGSNSERFVKDLTTGGKLWSKVGLRMERGEPCNCHENSRRIASKCPERYLRCTGYALSADSVWRPHSWVWDVKRKRIIETTEKRLIYFGVIDRTE